MLDHVPGLFTSTIAAIVMPRKTSSETSRLGFAAKSLGDMSHRLPRTNTDQSVFIRVYLRSMLKYRPVHVLNACGDRRAAGRARAHDCGRARQDGKARKRTQIA